MRPRKLRLRAVVPRREALRVRPEDVGLVVDV